ncbi:hypothetical protein ACH5RR_028891 [Cinchona calisaya]|uniref:F-box domain-containing protein n=1 Tax=Cinchona calisaya TaxID=153742 RepID=A0ABD2YTP6_9GENT
MDSNQNLEKDRLGRPRKSEEDHQKDWLSGLPDEILLHILSFLPIKDAVKTVLIRRFGSLWRSIPILDFDQCKYHSCYNGPYCNKKFINLIHQVKKLNDSSRLAKLRLKFAFLKGCDNMHKDHALKSTTNEIDALVHYALGKKVNFLDLDVLGCGFLELIEDYSVPDDVFRSDHLTELRLAFCNIEFHGEISLKSLKVLSLNEIELNDKLMEKVLVGCPSLEDLSLIGCFGFRKLNCSAIRNLKKLKLVLYTKKTLIITCPSVVSLEIAGCVESARLLDVSSVIDTS